MSHFVSQLVSWLVSSCVSIFGVVVRPGLTASDSSNRPLVKFCPNFCAVVFCTTNKHEIT